MSDGVFIQEGDFLCWCWAAEGENGKWHGFASFERKADHAQAVAPNMRHRLKEEFDSETIAMSRALEFAKEIGRSGKAGF
jgi:hypothetical protein